jgi:hypothetical protein
MFFFFLAFGGDGTGTASARGGKGIVPVLSDGNINYNGTTIKKKETLDANRMQKTRNQASGKETKGGQMEKKPRGWMKGADVQEGKESPRRIQNQILGRAPCQRQEKRCRSSGLGGGRRKMKVGGGKRERERA